MYLPVGGINWGMKAYKRGYLRARAEISADKDGDIFGQKRRYLPAKPHKGLTDKVHIVVIIPPTSYVSVILSGARKGVVEESHYRLTEQEGDVSTTHRAPSYLPRLSGENNAQHDRYIRLPIYRLFFVLATTLPSNRCTVR